MREMINVLPESETKAHSEEMTLNWKHALELGLCRSSVHISAERYWATLCSRMRDLCPETKWISICENNETIDLRSIKALQFWLESLITCPEWPFPEEVILISTKSKECEFRIIIPKRIEKLPQGRLSRDLNILSFKDKYSSGWKIKLAETFLVTKAGEA